MAIDTGQYISEIDPALPANGAPRAEGAGQIRAVKNALKQSFPNVDKEVPATADVINQMTDGTQGRFRGEVTMFSGNFEDIPNGWVICDGTIQNQFNTPDLRGRFVLGYDPTTDTLAPVGSTGGDNNPNLSTHLTVDGHVLTVSEMPPHDHDTNLDSVFPINETGGEWPTPRRGTGHKTSVVGGGEAHAHGLTAVTSDGVPTFDNRPAYAVLIFICYVGLPLST